MAARSDTAEYLSLTQWEPEKHLRQVTFAEVEYSRGFLRCAPQQWFPSLAAQWLPLSHALVIELRVPEVKCLLSIPGDATPRIAFQGTVDGETVALLMDERAAHVILNSASPDGFDAANSIILEYLSRRLLTSLSLSWTASENSVFKFGNLVDPAAVKGSGVVKVSVCLNNEICSIWFSLGPRMVERMDGLWRRQLVSQSTRNTEADGEYLIELTQLGVPPAQVAQYVRSGAVVDLEVPIGDRGVLRRKDGFLLPVRLCGVEGELALEPHQQASTPPSIGSGMTRVSVCFGRVLIDSAAFTELQQPGAMWNTRIPLSDNLQMIINGEKIADVLLGIYQGRFAVQVK